MGCVGSDQKNRKKEKQSPPEPVPESKTNNDKTAGQWKQQQHLQRLGNAAADIDFKAISHAKAEPSHPERSKAQDFKDRAEIQNSANSLNRKATIEKYNISVKNSQNKVLSINTYDYHGLLMSNSGALQVK